MKKIVLIGALLFSSLIFYAQQPVKEEKPNIEVNGSAELEIVPDEIYVTIVLREKPKANDRWKIEVQEDNLLKKLKENGFDLKNLSLSGANGEYEYYFFRKDKVITAKWLLMKLSTAGEVNKLFIILDELEIDDARISRTSHSQLEKFRKEVKINAMKAAKDKADYLLTAIGQQTGKPLFVKEQDYTGPINVYGSNARLDEVVVRGVNSQAMVKGFEDQVAFSKLKIKYEIFARFEIK